MYTGEYSEADLALIVGSGVTKDEVDAHWAMFPDQNLDVAISHVVAFKNGLGQERTEDFTAETVVVGDVSGESITETTENLPVEEAAAE